MTQIVKADAVSERSDAPLGSGKHSMLLNSDEGTHPACVALHAPRAPHVMVSAGVGDARPQVGVSSRGPARLIGDGAPRGGARTLCALYGALYAYAAHCMPCPASHVHFTQVALARGGDEAVGIILYTVA